MSVLKKEWQGHDAPSGSNKRMTMAVAQKYLYAPVGYRRLARIFAERGCKIKYGENALVPGTQIVPKLDEA